MANTIKLKTGSGSDPSASDLIVGEIAIRTDSGKLFTKKDNGSVAEISGGGGIDDGDKGDITVSNGGDTFTIDNGVVTSAKIADGTIVNADINASAAIAGSKIASDSITSTQIANDAITANELANNSVGNSHIIDGTITNADINGSAAIAGTKISPDFGSQNVVTTGNLDVASLDLAGNLDITDGTVIIDNDANSPNTSFGLAEALRIDDSGVTQDRGLSIYEYHQSGGRFFSLNYNLESTSNGSAYVYTQGLYSGSTMLQIGANDFRFFVDAQVSSVSRDAITPTRRFRINTSGVDVTGNLAVTGTVDGVDIAARNTLFGGLTSSSGVLTNGVTATTQGASDNTTKVATTAYVTTAISNLINGAPSALDTLNELAAAMNDDAAFSTTVTNSLATKMPLAGGEFTGNVTFSGSQTVDGRDLSVDGSKLDGIESGATADQTASEILTLIKTVDGAGSGLNADLLDGISSASFVRSDADDTLNGQYTISDSANEKLVLAGSNDPYIRFQEGTTNKAYIQWHSDGYINLVNSESSESVRIQSGSSGLKFVEGGNVRNVYHTGNLSEGDGGLTTNNFTDADHSKLNGIESGATADQTNSEIKTAYEANSNTNAFTDALLSKLNGIAASATNVTNNNQLTNGAGYITATLTNEQVQDIVGGMVTGNTESGITVTYQDGDGTLDFTVGTLNQNTTGNAATATKLATARTIAGVSFDGSANISLNNNAITNGAGYLTSVGTSNIANDAITQAKIADDAVGADQIATNSIQTNRLQDDAVTTAKIDDGAVTAAKILAGNVTTNNIGDDAVTYAKIQNVSATNRILGRDSSGAGVIEEITPANLRTMLNVADGATNVTNTNQLTNGAGFITATLTNEQVQDIVGGMVTGNTESGITVTYQDSDGTLDFAVGTLNQNTTGNAATATQLANARTIAGVSFNGTANISLNNASITNGAGYITGFSGVAGGGTFTGGIIAPRISANNGIMEMKQEIGTSQTLTTGYNAIAVAPTVANGVTITVPSGAVWAIV